MTDEGFDLDDGLSEGFFKAGEEMNEDAVIQSLLCPRPPLWKRVLYHAFFAGLLAAGVGMASHSIDRIVQTSRLEQSIRDESRRRDTLQGELDAIRYQAGIVEDDGTLISWLPLDPPDREALQDYCRHPGTHDDARASTRRIYQGVLEIEVQRNSGSSGWGSGVLLTRNGYVATAHHVMDDFVGGIARTHDGQEYHIEHPILISSPHHDIAIIRIGRDGPALAVPVNRDVEPPVVGMEVFVFGFYDGLPFNQMGSIMQVGYDARYSNLFVEDTALTSTFIRGGFSGGAVVRAVDGALIGITTYAISRPGSGLGSPSGFVPLSSVCEVLDTYLRRQDIEPQE